MEGILFSLTTLILKLNKTHIMEHLKSQNPTHSEIVKCTPQNYLGQALKEIRIEKGLTQQQAAVITGIDQNRWSTYETGKRSPNLDTIIQIALGLKFNPLDLITRSLVKSPYFESIKDAPFSLSETNQQQTTQSLEEVAPMEMADA